MILCIHALNDLPLCNADLNGETPPCEVRRLREAVSSANGLVIASPEYSHSMSGVLKNALDWLSPIARFSPWMGKPVLIIIASPAFFGGSSAQHQLSEALYAVCANLINFLQVVITEVSSKIQDHRLVDQGARATSVEAMEALHEAATESLQSTTLI